MDVPSLEDLVRSHVHLPSRPSAQGWYPVLCKVCNDHGKKGPRAAFMFENGGVGYHCFNCPAKGSFVPGESRTVSKALEEILLAYGIDQDDIARFRFELLGHKDEQQVVDKKAVVHEPKELSLPSHFKTLDYDSVWCEVVREYLAERMINADSYPFMISTGESDDLKRHPPIVQAAMIKTAAKWVGRVIIPIYKGSKLIFYIGRDMTDSKIKKYESPSSPKHNVLFGFDKLFEHTDKPLYVMEGVMDALIVDGVAVLGNKLTDSHIHWLNKSNRQKVYVPDKFGDGNFAAEQAHAQGWAVSCPDFGDAKDVNKAAQQYGKLFILTELADKTFTGFEAELNIKSYCK